MTAPTFVVRHEIDLSDDTKSFLAGLARSIVAGINELETHMSQLDDALTAIGSNVDELVHDVQRLIDATIAAGNLTADQQAAVDAIQGKLGALDAAVEAVDPEPAP